MTSQLSVFILKILLCIVHRCILRTCTVPFNPFSCKKIISEQGGSLERNTACVSAIPDKVKNDDGRMRDRRERGDILWQFYCHYCSIPYNLPSFVYWL